MGAEFSSLGAGSPVARFGAIRTSQAGLLLCAVLAQPLRAARDADRTADGPRQFARLAGPMRLVWSHPALRLLAGCSFFFSMAQMTVTTYLVTYLPTPWRMASSRPVLPGP